MGLFDFFSQRSRREYQNSTPATERQIAVGADEKGNDVTLTFNDRNITFSGSLESYDYDSIQRNKQGNITRLYELSDYYVDEDPIYRGIIKEVYTPFSIADDFKLIGANEKVKKKYLEYYEKIHLRDKMRSIFYQYYKYGNVYIYLMDDGSIITLPVHKVRIANIMIDGEPVIEFNCRSVKDDLTQQGIKAQKDFIEDDNLDIRLKGFPKEVGEAIKEGKEWVQLNPANTFVLQDLKEDWMRYAIPMISACLKAFAKKELISNYENSLLNLGARSFVHAKYGDAKTELLINAQSLTQVANIFRQAMKGTAQAVTNHLVNAEVIQPDMNDMFEHDKYKCVNADILSAGGISGIIVSGRSDDGSTFASAQVSMKTAAIRIKQAKDGFCKVMDKINRRLNGSSPAMPHSADEHIPKFTFPPVDLAGNKDFQEACLKLWKEGVVSSETLLSTYGYDIKQEAERKKKEQSDGTENILRPAAESKEDSAADQAKVGRPEMSESERNSDEANSLTGKQPKPSNPNGSM